MTEKRPARLRYQLAGFFVARAIVNTLYRMIYPFTGVLARGLGVPVAQVAGAIALRSSLGLAAPLLGSAADIGGRKRAMLIGLGLFSAGALTVALLPAFLPFVAGLLLTTIGKIMFDPAMQAHLGDATQYGRRGQAIALTELGWSLSFLIGVPVMGLLIVRFGWSAPFPVLGILGVLAGFGLVRLLPADPRRQSMLPSMRSTLRGILANQPAMAGLGMGLLISAANESINIVFGIWLETSFGMQVAALGAAAAVIGVAELSGEGLVAGFADRVGKPRAVALGLLGNSVSAAIFPLLGRTELGALLALFLFYLTFEFTLVSSIPLMTELAPRARASLMSGNVAALSLGRVLGAGLGLALFPLGLAANVGATFALNVLALLILVVWVREAVPRN